MTYELVIELVKSELEMLGPPSKQCSAGWSIVPATALVWYFMPRIVVTVVHDDCSRVFVHYYHYPEKSIDGDLIIDLCDPDGFKPLIDLINRFDLKFRKKWSRSL